MEKFKLLLNQISNTFGHEYNEQFFACLKSISKPNKQICNREIKRGEGGFRCIDCTLCSNAIYCTDCFNKTKDKHKNHNVLFKPYASGFCDCGDPNSSIKESFCPEHQGPITNENDLMRYIKTCVDENKLNIINPILNNIFSEIIKIISDIFNIDKQNEEKEKIKNELYNILDELIIFLTNLYENNLGLFYFVTLKFTENFPYETNHKCYKYDDKENKIIMIKENLVEKHICICPFFQVMINVLQLKKTKLDSKSIFTLFIQNFKNNIITSISFVHSFAELHENKNLESFKGLGYQVLNPKLCEILYNGKNNEFLENIFLEIYEKTKKFLELKKYSDASDLIVNLSWILGYLPTLNEFNKICSYTKIHSIIIDTISLINNLNCFENKIKFNIYQRDGYLYHLLSCEMYSLQIVVQLSYLMDFDKTESIKYIFDKIITKLIDYKNYKDSLLDKTFSPHISLIRFYSILLNKFCFHYSLNNNCDLLDSFQYFQNLYPKSKELNLFLFKELITYFGFIIAQKYSYFVYYGEDMNLYYVNYFKREPNFIFPDFSLFKYLLAIPEIQNYFNINNLDNILNYSNIDNCNNFLLNFDKINFNEKNEELNEEIKNNEKNLKYFNSLIEFLLIILRDNLSMIKCSFKYSDNFKMNYKDKIFEKLLLKEKINLENLIKNEIIHNIVGNKNLIKRENCLDIYNFYDHEEEMDINLINNLLKENCDEVSFSNQLKQYSLKKQKFSIFDIDYIINGIERGNAINYTSEFQSNNYNILNTNIFNPLSIQEKLNNKIYNSFFNDKNIENFINFYKIIINNNYPLLTDTFLFIYSKILCVYIKFYNNDLNEEIKKNLYNTINNNKLEGKNKSYIEYIKQLLLPSVSISEKNIENKISNDKSKNIKDKYKKKFEKKIQSIDNKYSSMELNLEMNISSSSIYSISSETEEICIYCRQYLDNGLNNCYGKVGFQFRDFFIDILKNKDEKLRKKTTRFVSCNHNIHYDCYNKLITNGFYGNTLKDGFPCTLCKKLSNTIICNLTNLNNDYENILKGLNFNDENYDKFYNKKDVENDLIEYPHLMNGTISFFHNYYYNLFKKEINLKEIKVNSDIFNEIYNLILKDFDTFTIYYNFTNLKKEQIDIWKDILLTIRLLCKNKLLDYTKFLFTKFKTIYNNLQKLTLSYLNNFEINTIINEFILCLFILYDLDEDNKNKIKDIFQNNILIYIFVYEFLKSKEDNFKEFLNKKENKDCIQNLFNYFDLKYKICFLLYGEKEENLKINHEEILLNNIKLIQDLINNNRNIILKEQYLGIPKFNIITLPENFIDFSSYYMNLKCVNCSKKEINYYICLICGNKICNHVQCIVDIKLKGKKEYSLIEHSKKCGGGNSIFLEGKTSEIVFLFKRRLINSGIHVYLNSFGEFMNDYDFKNNYILNKVELDKSIQIFIDMSFRKRLNKLKSIIQNQ